MRNHLSIVWALVALLMVPGAQAQRGSTQDPLASALQRDSVYVGKTRRSTVDANALQAMVQQEPADRPLKIAVLSQLPPSGRQYGTRDRYTKALHNYLHLGRGTLIIVTQRGVSAATDAVPSSRITQILRQDANQIQSDPAAGLRQAVADLDVAANGQASSSNSGAAPGAPNGNVMPQELPAPGGGFDPWWLIVPIGAGGLALWAGSKAAKRRREMQQAQIPVKRLRGEVVNGISYADSYLDLLPESPAATAAREARGQAAALYEQAMGLARHAHTAQDYGRAQALLEQAKEQTDLCRKQIDAATGGTGFAVAVEGTDYKATPASANGQPVSQAAPVVPGLRAEDIPPEERAACFFCSRPARISDLTPITIAINGQRRKVLACADDVRIVQQGATPEIRTVSVNGQHVPWYSAPQYDPYRDYARTEVVYAPAYGGYYDGGFTEGLLLGSLLSPPVYPMPYPVFVTPGGEYTNDFQAAAAPAYADGGAYGVGGADFGGIDGGGDFTGGDQGVGGVDFGGGSDFGNADFGSSDSSSDAGGVDFGGGDSGGADFGGDSGGSDFGGDSGGGDY